MPRSVQDARTSRAPSRGGEGRTRAAGATRLGDVCTGLSPVFVDGFVATRPTDPPL